MPYAFIQIRYNIYIEYIRISHETFQPWYLTEKVIIYLASENSHLLYFKVMDRMFRQRRWRESEKKPHTHIQSGSPTLAWNFHWPLCFVANRLLLLLLSTHTTFSSWWKIQRNVLRFHTLTHSHTQTHFLVYFPNFSFISHTSSFVKCVMCMCIEFCLCMYEWMGMAGMDRTLVHAPRPIQQLFIVNINNRDNFASLAKSRWSRLAQQQPKQKLHGITFSERDPNVEK